MVWVQPRTNERTHLGRLYIAARYFKWGGVTGPMGGRC